MPKTKKNKIKNNKRTKKNLSLSTLHNFEINFNNLKNSHLKSNKLEKDKIKLEELSTQLLLKIDMLEINGDQLLRQYRKTIINLINTYIDNLQ